MYWILDFDFSRTYAKVRKLRHYERQRSNLPTRWDCFPTLRFGRNDNFGLRKSYVYRLLHRGKRDKSSMLKLNSYLAAR